MPAKRVHFEMVLVAVEYCVHYPPHIVYPVGIEEAHRPFVLFRRKTAEHQHTCAIGQKGCEGVFSVGIFVCCFQSKKSYIVFTYKSNYFIRYCSYIFI